MSKLVNVGYIPIICLILLNCNNLNNNNMDLKVNYMVSKYHFVKNVFTPPADSCVLIIYSYHAFDSLFGVAAIMGMDTSKVITESKMSNSFVISIFYRNQNYGHVLSIDTIYKNRNILKFIYTSSIDSSWAGSNCHKEVLINNTDYDSIQFVENGNVISDIQILYFQ